MKKINTQEVAINTFDKHCSITNSRGYPEILSLEGLARLWEWTKNEVYLEKFQKEIRPFVAGELKNMMGAYHLYNVGGSPAALMLRLGVLPDAERGVYEKVEDLLANCNRSKEGIFSTQELPLEFFTDGNQPYRVWIDAAFGFCPFLCNAGIYLKKDEWINESVEQIVSMTKLLRDHENGLYHQARGFCGPLSNTDPEKISECHWSRGNGWGLFTLAELAQDLPKNHPRRPEIEKLLIDSLDACLEFQDEHGMWHQEITDFDSYAETSGTGLILYALGVAIEKKIVPENKKKDLIKGLKGFSSYIALDGSIHNCCTACNSPGNGTIEEYKAVGHLINDRHAFGPVILAFGQAAKIGVSEISI